jgi:hypothetical protein
MKAQEHRNEHAQRSRFEADLAARIAALFRRWPTLCGFSVGEEASRLYVTEVSVYPWTGLWAPEELCLEIVAALVELVDDRPEAGELLRERTFARVFH